MKKNIDTRRRILRIINVLKKHKDADLNRLKDKAMIAEDIIDELESEFKQERGL
jgi:hypothetical protein